MTLRKGEPFIDMAITIINKAKDNWPEADWLCLPFNISQPQFGVYRQLGVMNPATDIQEGANRHIYSADYGVTVTGTDVTLLRLWEQAGETSAIKIKLPKALKATTAQPVNLRGEPVGEPLPVKNHTIATQIGAYAPLSMLLH